MPPGLQEFFEALSAWALLLWIAFILLVLGVVCRWLVKAWPNLKRLVALIDALIGLPEFMERIRHQVENDHSTNLRDEVTQILELADDTAVKVATITDQVSDLASWQKKHELKSDDAMSRIHALEQKENR